MIIYVVNNKKNCVTANKDTPHHGRGLWSLAYATGQFTKSIINLEPNFLEIPTFLASFSF